MEDLVIKVTKETNTTEDWDGILHICETANLSGSRAREAVGSLSKRLLHRNANVALYALTVLNAMMQNCSPQTRAEISSRIFTDAFSSLLHNTKTHAAVKSRALSLLHSWCTEHEKESDLAFLIGYYKQLQSLGHRFQEPDKHAPGVRHADAAAAKRRKEEEDLQLAIALSLSAQQQQQMHMADASRSSFSSSPRLPRSPSQVLFECKALFDFAGHEEGELALSRGDIIQVMDHASFSPWWKGVVVGKGSSGIFPSNYVERIQSSSIPSDRVLVTGSVSGSLPNVLSIKVANLLHEISSKDYIHQGTGKLSAMHQDLVTSHSTLKAEMDLKTGQRDTLHDVHRRFLVAQEKYQRLMEAHRFAMSQQQPIYQGNSYHPSYHSSYPI